MNSGATRLLLLIAACSLAFDTVCCRTYADPSVVRLASQGPLMRVSRARHDVSSLVLQPGANLIGEGWTNNSNVGHGGSEWSSLEGSVIHCTGSGVCVSFIPVAHHPSPIHLENIAIIGNGQGTGLQLGDATHTPVFGTVSNVLIANFSTGLKFAGEDFNFNGLFLQANEVGLSITVSTANENCWYGLRLHRNGTGMSISAGYELNFFGGLVQSNNIGMLIGKDCSNCEVEGFDVEGNAAAGVINRGGDNVFINNRFGGGTGDSFRIESGPHCVLMGNRVMGRNQMFIGSQAPGTVLVGNAFNGMTDQSKRVIDFGSTILK